MTRFLRWTFQAGILAFFVVYLVWPEGIVSGEVLFRVDAITVGTAALSARIVFLSVAFSIGLIVLTFLMGRVFCGWACPLGAMIDALDLIISRRPRFHSFRRVKYHLLVASICLAAFGITLAWLFDPMAWASRLGSLLAPSVELDWVAIVVLTGILAVMGIVFGRRGFCRVLCPLGALLGSIASISPFTRTLGEACTRCGTCTKTCRTGAIGSSPDQFSKAECIHCKDCTKSCPESALDFNYFGLPFPTRPDPLRRQYLLSLGGGAAAGLLIRRYESKPRARNAVHPPGAVKKDRFGDLCIRCGSCIRVCPKQSLSPAIDEAGPILFQTPVLSGRKGGCKFDCKACSEVCPTGAIRKLSLTEKKQEKIGLAIIDQKRCVAFAKQSPCVVCYTSCPLSAIEFVPTDIDLKWGERLFTPKVKNDACTGCGLCEAICPLAGKAGIRIVSLDDV
ncbi:MAG: 4Fe-4S dicluster domain-containing protein [Proteobacteria bacterium]|nr:4Fe-4S dicluster domain-containing protein [Pseudomonadota bacterium]